MPDPKRTSIFVSYSHADRKLLDEFKRMLAPVLRGETLDLWDDSRIRTGDKWLREIEQAMERAVIAVLLVSPAFLASRFITDTEVPTLLAKAQAGGLKVCWICLEACFYDRTPIGEYQAANDPNRPLKTLKGAARSKELKAICKKLLAMTETQTNEQVSVKSASSATGGKPVYVPCGTTVATPQAAKPDPHAPPSVHSAQAQAKVNRPLPKTDRQLMVNFVATRCGSGRDPEDIVKEGTSEFGVSAEEMRQLLTQHKEAQRRCIQSIKYSIQEFARGEYRGLGSKERTVELLLAQYGQAGLSEAEAEQFAEAVEQEFIDKTYIKVDDARRQELKEELQQREAEYLSSKPLATLLGHVALDDLFEIFAVSPDWGSSIDPLSKRAPELVTCGSLLRECQRDFLNLRSYVQELRAIRKVLAQIKTLGT